MQVTPRTKEESWLLEEKYDGTATEAFRADCKRLAEGEPLAYLIGYVSFLDTTIYLDSHPLIPRPETEHWVECAIAAIQTDVRRRTSDILVLDLCAGSGCIGVAVAYAIPDAHVDFVEIATEHHKTIETNIEANGIDRARTRVMSGDLFTKMTDTYDYVLTNPPYIDATLKRTDAEVVANEPHRALYGGAEGMEYIRRIIADAPDHLTPEGTLYMEHEPEQMDAIQRLATDSGFTCTTHPDQYHIDRYSILTRSETS